MQAEQFAAPDFARGFDDQRVVAPSERTDRTFSGCESHLLIARCAGRAGDAVCGEAHRAARGAPPLADIAEPFGPFAFCLVDIIPDRQRAGRSAFPFKPDRDVGAVIFGDGEAGDGDAEVEGLGGCWRGCAERRTGAEDKFVAAGHRCCSPGLMNEIEN